MGELHRRVASTVTPRTHTHGLSARVTLHGDADFDTILRKLEWSPRHRGWVRSEPKGGTRWQLRSSAWLTGRRASRTSGVGKRNRRWGTAIASLNLQHGAAGWAIGIETVRRDDIPPVEAAPLLPDLESVLGGPDGESPATRTATTTAAPEPVNNFETHPRRI